MKKSMMLFMAILLAVLGTGLATAGDITIYDKMGTGSGWYGAQEDQEVEPRCAANQSWDLEGFILEGNKLKMVGGFDFKNGNSGFTSGDIFISTSTSIPPTPPLFGSGNTGPIQSGYSVVSNRFGYNYAIHLDFNDNTYDTFTLTSSSMVKTIWYGHNNGSNPWDYASGGTPTNNGNGAMQYVAGLSDAATAAATGFQFQGGSHNIVTVDLGFLPSGTDFYAHFTMGCGNDDLMGQGRTQVPTNNPVTPVPEPGTMILLGSGLIGISRYARKKIK